MTTVAQSAVPFKGRISLTLPEPGWVLTPLDNRVAKTWSSLVSAPKDDPGVDVKDMVLSLHGSYRHVRLDFARRETGDKFELCEVEIWGNHK